MENGNTPRRKRDKVRRFLKGFFSPSSKKDSQGSSPSLDTFASAPSTRPITPLPPPSSENAASEGLFPSPVFLPSANNLTSESPSALPLPHPSTNNPTSESLSGLTSPLTVNSANNPISESLSPSPLPLSSAGNPTSETFSASRLPLTPPENPPSEGLLASPLSLPSANNPISEGLPKPSFTGLKVAGRFIQTLMTKLPEIIDGNPAKMALSLAKVIIEIKKGVEDNMDAVERRIASTGEQLDAVAKALDGWHAKSEKERQCVERLKLVLEVEFAKLSDLSKECIGRKIVDYEDEKSRIAEIFERINEARIQFGLETDLRLFKVVNAIEEVHRRALLKDLEPSKLADHKYHLEGEKKEMLRRAVCTPGTRERLLNDIVTWAKDPSSETIYWLFGSAGTGKSTIAFTIARRFELATPEDTIILGGNFFSSRQFEETRFATRIIRTITYHLALRCKAFADALTNVGQFDTVNQSVSAQLDGLLVGPWKAAESVRLADPLKPPQQYLIVIDALDEIDGNGGSEFLNDLLNVINAKHLTGLKFFVTSRPDPNLVTRVDSFGNKQLYRLEEVPLEEAEADIRTYLNASLPGFAEVGRLVELAGGLFIYAATVTKHLERHTKVEQTKLLKRLLPSFGLPSAIPQTSSDATVLLDRLYHQILFDTFDQFKDDILANRLKILHTFLCTAERTSPIIVANLLCPRDADQPQPDVEAPHEVVKNLYAVLYIENDKVLWYHKSFPDFLFDRNRSKEFWCNVVEDHQHLVDASFRVMKQDLRFNIANIKSSFLLDCEDSALPGAVAKNISPTLTYCCQHWEWHLSSMALPVESNPFHEALSEFLMYHGLFWIEAMNLLGLSGLCDQMLRRASRRVTKANSALSEQLIEAASFATYFSGSLAASSSPHLYTSALSTWPRDLEPCKGWKSRFPGIPAFRNARRGDSLLLVTIRVESQVNSVAFSTNGTRIVSGSGDNFVRVWDASTGKELNTLVGHTGSVQSVAFSADGTRIVSGSDDESVRVWDVPMGKELNTLMGHTGQVNSVAFSSNGMYIVSGSADCLVRVWSLLTEKDSRELMGHEDWVRSVAFSTDGTRIVSGSDDRSVRIWNASTSKALKVLIAHTDWVFSVAISTDGAQIVSGSRDNSVRVWDASTGQKLSVLIGHTESVYSVGFSTDGTRIVSGSADKSVRVWNTSTGMEFQLLGHTGTVTSAAFSSDGTRIVSGSHANTVQVWAAPTGKELTALPVVDHADLINSDILSSSSGQGSGDKSAQVLDRPMAKELNAPIGHTGMVYSVAFSTDASGTRIVSASADQSVRVWDASTGKELVVLTGHQGKVNSVAFSSDGTRIISGSDDNSIRVWDALMGVELNVLIGHTERVRSVAFSFDSTRIVSGSNDESVRVWDALTGVELNVLTGHTGVVYSVAFSNDGTRIVSGSRDESVRVWDVLTGNKLNVLSSHTGDVNSVAFSADGTRIISGSADKSVRVWDASTGKQLNVMRGHTNWVRSVAFSSDGTRIVSGSFDKSVRVWDALTGEELNVLMGHTNWVRSVAFSTDGTRIVSGSSDKTIRVWDVSPETSYFREQTDRRSLGSEPTYTGWLLSLKNQAKLMFVPPDALSTLDSSILTIPYTARKGSWVDFTNAKIGPQWHECYHP